jgi:hypothetical protein
VTPVTEAVRELDAVAGGDRRQLAHRVPGIGGRCGDVRDLLEEGLEARRHGEAEMAAAR